jgi:hypothetical protein
MARFTVTGVVRLRQVTWFWFCIRMPDSAKSEIAFLGHTFSFASLVHGLKPVAIDEAGEKRSLHQLPPPLGGRKS